MGSGGSRSIISANTREGAYGGGHERLRDDLRTYSNSYYEHIDKIKKDPYDRYNVSGWANQCRHFAAKAFETGCKLLDQGAKIDLSEGGSVLKKADHVDLQKLYSQRLAELERFERDARG
jgi:hypothetical protein